MNAISVRGLTKLYSGRNAVDGIDLDVAEGEVFALLGPNGAGKSTTVEILEGHRRRDGGEVSVLGEDPQTAGTVWRRGIGIVLQDASDVGELTAREVIGHFARYYRNSRGPDEVLAQVGLTEQARRRVRLLSGGQRRRLDVAVGIVGRPRLLFLDEPTTGFDPEARRQFWDLIRSLAAEGTTILLTTHYLEEAEELAHRVAVLAQGRIVACDAPSTLAGRNNRIATVTWLDDGVPRELRTEEPGRAVAELAARLGGDVPGLTVTRPTLEDVYLQLMGNKS